MLNVCTFPGETPFGQFLLFIQNTSFARNKWDSATTWVNRDCAHRRKLSSSSVTRSFLIICPLFLNKKSLLEASNTTTNYSKLWTSRQRKYSPLERENPISTCFLDYSNAPFQKKTSLFLYFRLWLLLPIVLMWRFCLATSIILLKKYCNERTRCALAVPKRDFWYLPKWLPVFK